MYLLVSLQLVIFFQAVFGTAGTTSWSSDCVVLETRWLLAFFSLGRGACSILRLSVLLLTEFVWTEECDSGAVGVAAVRDESVLAGATAS